MNHDQFWTFNTKLKATKAYLIVFLFLKDSQIKRLSFLNNILHKYLKLHQLIFLFFYLKKNNEL